MPISKSKIVTLLSLFESGGGAKPIKAYIEITGTINANLIRLALIDSIKAEPLFKYTLATDHAPFILETSETLSLNIRSIDKTINELVVSDIIKRYDFDTHKKKNSSALFFIQLIHLSKNRHLIIWQQHAIIQNFNLLNTSVEKLFKTYNKHIDTLTTTKENKQIETHNVVPLRVNENDNNNVINFKIRDKVFKQVIDLQQKWASEPWIPVIVTLLSVLEKLNHPIGRSFRLINKEKMLIYDIDKINQDKNFFETCLHVKESCREFVLNGTLTEEIEILKTLKDTPFIIWYESEKTTHNTLSAELKYIQGGTLNSEFCVSAIKNNTFLKLAIPEKDFYNLPREHIFEDFLSSVIKKPKFKIKELLNISFNTELNISLAATFTAAPLEPILKEWFSKINIATKIEITPIDPIPFLLYDYRLHQKNNVLLIKLDDWLKPVPITIQIVDKSISIDQQQHCYLPDGQLIFEYHNNETSQLFEEIFTDNIYLKNGINLEKGSVIFDVGANIGMFSFFIHRVCENAKIYAFEPMPDVLEVLNSNVKLYKLPVEVFDTALTNIKGIQEAVFYSESSLQSGLFANEVYDTEIAYSYAKKYFENETYKTDLKGLVTKRLKPNKIYVKTDTISNIIDRHSIAQIDLLKIDVEKSEQLVLEGIRDEHWLKIKQLVIEVHDHNNRLKEIISLLEHHKFKISQEKISLFEETDMYMIYASRKSKNVDFEETKALQQVNTLVEILEKRTSESTNTYWAGFCPSKAKWSEKIEQFAIKKLSTIKHINLIDFNKTLNFYNLSEVHQNTQVKRLGVPYNTDFFSVIATEIVRKTTKSLRVINKVLAVDADNTLWGGICGEQSPENLIITEPFLSIQHYILEQKSQGKLIVLVSRNNIEDLKFTFDALSGKMPIAWDDFSMIEANWGRKSNSLIRISKALNLGLDSFIMLDDDPREREEIRLNCPNITVIELPKATEYWIKALQQTWQLDSHNLTKTDQSRAAQYKNEEKRSKEKTLYKSFKTYLNALKIEVIIKESHHEDSKRLEQLSLRTNQFNLCTQRHSEEDILTLIDGFKRVFSVFVKDRFGDYGLVGMIVCEIEKQRLIITDFLLSCRVMGKNIEWNIANFLAQQASSEAINEIEFKIRYNPKNRPAQLFFESLKNLNSNHDIKKCVIPVEKLLQINWYEINEINQKSETVVSNTLIKTYNWPAPAPISIEALIDLTVTPEQKPRPNLNVIFQPPLTALEIKICKIWCSVLGISRIGINDNFQKLGGDSISALRIMGKINESCNLTVSLEDLLFDGTVASLAYKYAHQSEPTNWASRSNAIDNYTLASPGQIRIWASEEMNFTNDHIIPIYYEIKGALNVAALKQSFLKIIERHKALRTILEIDQNKIIQRVVAPSLLFDYLDVTASTNKEVKQIVNTKLEGKFDLSKAPLLKITLLKISEKTHQLLLVFHHSASDGWSIKIILQELSKIYRAYNNDHALTLEPSVDFSTYSNALWNTSKTETFKVSIQDYIDELNTFPVHNFIKKEANDHAASTEMITDSIPEYIKTAIEDSSKRLNISSFNFYIAALQMTLYHWNNGVNTSILTPYSNRDDFNVQKIVGFITNMVVIPPEKIEADDSVMNYLKRVSNNMVNVFNHTKIPFGLIAQQINIPEVMFTLQNIKFPKLSLKGCELHEAPLEKWPVPFPLMIDIEDNETYFNMRIRYQTRYFNAIDILDLKHKFLQSLAFTSVCLYAPIAKINTFFNNQKFENNFDLLDNIATYSQTTPNAIAVEDKNNSITYDQLDKLSDKVAASIITKTSLDQNLIGVAMKRTTNLLVVIIALLKAGKGFIPIDLTHPQSRIKKQLEQSNTTVVISDESAELDFGKNTIILSINDLVKAPHSLLQPISQDIAYMIFTSGSTGASKGVMISRKALSHYLNWAASAYCSEGKGTLAYTSIAVDFTITCLLLPLMVGKTTYCIINDEAEALNEALLHHKQLSFLKLTPSRLNILQTFVPAKTINKNTSMLVIGGEALHSSSLEFLKDDAPELIVVNEYGPTEATVGCVTYTFKIKNIKEGPIPIGKPIGHNQIHLIDPSGNLATNGEMYISGPSLAIGYINNLELTNSKFITIDSGNQEIKAYKTGDVAFKDGDDNLVFKGRIDEQIKIHGYRTELGEIENSINSHPLVLTSKVYFYKERKVLIAFIVGSNIVNIDITSIENHLRESLPVYSIPSEIYQVKQLPVTSSGKIDDTYLNRYINTINISKNKDESVVNAIEEKLMLLWKQLLNLETISLTQNFFSAGGDSIKALYLVAQCKEYNIHITSRDIFESLTIKKLAQKIAKSTPTIEQKVLSKKSIEITANQQAFFELDFFDFNHWTLPWFASCDIKIDPDKLEKAMLEVEAKHESLQCLFKPVDKHNWTVVTELIKEKPASKVHYIELNSHESLEDFKINASKTLDIVNGPIHKLFLIHHKNTHYIYWVMHHLVVDMISWHILNSDLWKAYEGLSLNKASTLLKPSASLLEVINFDIEMAWSSNGTSIVNNKSSVFYDTWNIKKPKDLSIFKSATSLLPYIIFTLGNAILDIDNKDKITIVHESHGRDLSLLDLSRYVGWLTKYIPINIEKNSTFDELDTVKTQIETPNYNSNFDRTFTVNFMGHLNTFEIGAFKPEWFFENQFNNFNQPQIFSVEFVVWIDENEDLNFQIKYDETLYTQLWLKKVLSSAKTYYQKLIMKNSENNLSESVDYDYEKIIKEMNDYNEN